MKRLVHFLKREDGAIAVEFAFVAPIMLGIFFGLAQLALALGVRNDVVNLASAGADLVAQENAATTADLTNVFSALSAMLYPYSTTLAKITISSIIDNNSASASGGNNPSGTVAWSCTQGGTVRSGTFTFPTAAQGVITRGSGDSVIMAEVTYTYTLPFAVNITGFASLTGPYTMTNTFFAKPRRVQTIPAPSACP
jgi:Flp pilus assembly protein TadG